LNPEPTGITQINETMEAPQNREFLLFGPPIKVKGGQHLPKHMG